MSTSHRDTLRTQALVDLDAAPPAALTTAQERQAEDTLARILSTAPGTADDPARRRRSRAMPRVLLLVGAAAALALLVSVTGVLGRGTAYATWTARPTVLPTAEQEDLAQQCRDYLSLGADPTAGAPSAGDLQAARLLLADTRGAWSYVVLSGDRGLEATCLVERATGLMRLLPGVRSAAGGYGFIVVPTPSARQVIGSGLMAMSASEGSAWSTEGHIGTEVAAVTVVTESGTEVEATLSTGRFAAWWPEREDIDDGGGLAQVRYIVTLTDGTVIPPQTFDEIGPVPLDE